MKVSGAWRIIGYAKDAAVNVQLGRPEDADVDGLASDAYFQTQGCDIYIAKAIADKRKDQAMGGGVLGAMLKIQSLGALGELGNHIDGERMPVWSQKRCSTTYQAIPSALIAYKLNRKFTEKK
jgi:hypothetical protein